MNIVVTGATGFIGSHLTAKLLDNGHHVYALDIESDNPLNSDRIFKHPRVKNLEFVDHDIRNDFDTTTFRRPIDAIFHLAALGSVPVSFQRPDDFIKTNIQGTHNVLKYAQTHDVKKVVLASSSSVYNMQSVYAMTKQAAESLFRVYWANYQLPVMILRYFNVFGPGQDPVRAVVPAFITSLLRGERPIIYGDGTQTRDFTYVKDVVNLTLKYGIDMNFSSFEFRDYVRDIAFKNPVSVKTIFDTLTRLMGIRVEPMYTNRRIGDVKHSWTENGTIKNESEQTPLENALSETIAFYRKKL